MGATGASKGEPRVIEKSSVTAKEMQRLLRQFDHAHSEKNKRPRKQRPWIRDIIAVLAPHPNGLSMSQLLAALWAMRGPALPMPEPFINTLQNRLSRYTAQSNMFWHKNPQPENNLFYSPGGKGSGTWALHRDKVADWLLHHGLNPK